MTSTFQQVQKPYGATTGALQTLSTLPCGPHVAASWGGASLSQARLGRPTSKGNSESIALGAPPGGNTSNMRAYWLGEAAHLETSLFSFFQSYTPDCDVASRPAPRPPPRPVQLRLHWCSWAQSFCRWLRAARYKGVGLWLEDGPYCEAQIDICSLAHVDMQSSGMRC